MDRTVAHPESRKKFKNEQKSGNNLGYSKLQHVEHSKLKNEHRSSSMSDIVSKTEDNKYIKQGDKKICSFYRPISPYEDDIPAIKYNGSQMSLNEADEDMSQSHLTQYNNQSVMFGCFSQVTEDMLNFHENFNYYPIGQLKYVQTTRQTSNMRGNNRSTSYVQCKNRSGYQNSAMVLSQDNHKEKEQHRKLKSCLRKLDGFDRGLDPIARRLHGLTYRLLSNSEVLQVIASPPGLLNRSLYDQLSNEIYRVYTKKVQQTETYEKKVELWRDFFLCIKKCVRHYALYIVGSTMTGFGLDSSDIDMCLLLRPFSEDHRLDAVHQLHHIKNYLLKYGHVIHSELILAKVPILKLREETSGFEIDLNCNNSVGIYNTHLLYSYGRCDWRVRPLVIMVKLWAQANRVNDAKNLTVSSYSWTLMLIQYLQCGVSPAVLPCLHNLCPNYFNIDNSHITDVHQDVSELKYFKSLNNQTLGELFIGFFGYYGSFDFGQYAISVRTGAPVLIEDCKRVRAPKNSYNQWKYLCIEEPFDFTNTARSVYDIAAFRHIKLIITKTYEELAATLMLDQVLPVTLKSDSFQ